ncbi:MAG: UDP-glucose/GDP-mannose dehydrogenase family protein [Phycisphaerae bacterium]
MRVGVIGCGYVGLVTATCLADSGNHVVAVDNNAEKVAQLRAGKIPIFEPGLAELLQSNMAGNRLTFTTDLRAAVEKQEVIFLAVGTPPAPDGSADVSALEFVASQLGNLVTRPSVIVVKSTVPPGTGALLESVIAEHSKFPCPVVSNPEFLKEGHAVDDFLRPDRVIIGAEDPAAAKVVEELFRPYVRNNRPILHMRRTAAELTKYAANAYLAMRISFINEIADYCESFGVDVSEVRRGIGTDARIGQHFLYPGIGYGGSCFPKDVVALAATGRATGINCQLISAVHERNQMQRANLAKRLEKRLGKDMTGKRVAVWGVAFKPLTDDIREAPALDLIETMLSRGAQITVFDPRALDSARAHFKDRIEYAEDAYLAATNADALLICTEWNEFRNPDFERLRETMKSAIIFDGRNLYDDETMRRHGIEYHSIGRPSVFPS